MSMSTHVVGYRPADETWNKMKTIWNTCASAQVPIPAKVLDFFDHEPPGDKPGAEVQIDKAVKPYKNEFSEGFEVNLALLPKDVNVIRFYNSY
jgi:hypothetical protein